MSGPVSRQDVPPEKAVGSDAEPQAVEFMEAREAVVGQFTVRRSLPKARRRTVGAWCFVDHFGPLAVEPEDDIGIGPHPHIGLATVTYLLDGQMVHRDSLGTEQVIRPGQLNLMTAGGGITHAEEPTGTYRGRVHGVQLWVAQPEGTRHDEPAFEHHGELPRVELPGVRATVLVGSFAGGISKARADTPLMGAALDVRAGAAEVELDPSYEHLLVVLEGVLVVGDEAVRPGRSAHLGPGRASIRVTTPDGARVLLLGGTPFEEQIVMWWNFVGRSKDELSEAGKQWTVGHDRFGRLASPLARVPIPKG